MDSHIILEILKWIFLVLLAGDICQFSRSLALHIIKKRKNRRIKEIGQIQESNQKEQKLHPETIEILTNLEKIKKQAILDKKTGKYEKKKAKVGKKPKD